MKVAIYARYSSDNQRPESIEDQIRACQELAASRGYVLDPTHIYKDAAKSGALKDRPALDALLANARARQFEAHLRAAFQSPGIGSARDLQGTR